MTIGRICSRQVDLAELNESTRIAAQRMLQRQVGSLIVVDALGVPVGILTDRHLVTKVMARGISPDDATVADAMTAHPHYVHEDASIEDGLRMMRAGRHRRLPVVDAVPQRRHMCQAQPPCLGVRPPRLDMCASCGTHGVVAMVVQLI